MHTGLSPVQPNHDHDPEWTAFSAGPFTAPTGTASAALGRSAAIEFDEVFGYLVADPVTNSEFAIDFGDHPHDSPHYLPSDYVESRLDELEGDIPHLLDDLADVDTTTDEPMTATS